MPDDSVSAFCHFTHAYNAIPLLGLAASAVGQEYEMVSFIVKSSKRRSSASVDSFRDTFELFPAR